MIDDNDPRIARIREVRARLNEIEAADKRVRAELVEAVRDALPPQGESVPVADRGLVTKAVEASGWTRAYVDGVRSGRYGGKPIA